jgi:uncharacterized protein (TIGR02996 family)
VASNFLLRHEDNPERSAAFAAWLIDQVEVRDLYFDDEQLEELLHELWDARDDGSQPTIEARRADLEAMLRNEPDNLAHRLVYGDWLLAHQDPLGELIARQLAVASAPDHPALERAASSYLRERANVLFGPLAEYLDLIVRLEWRGGFIEAATLGKPAGDSEPYEGAILLRWLLEHRTAMLLRELELHPFDYSWGRDQLRAMLDVLFERPRPLLRRLTVGQASTGELGELTRLDELLPNLEVLELRGRSVTLENFRHPKLRRLVWDNYLGPKQAAALATFELPRLESLTLGRVTHAELGSILGQLVLPSLRSLRVPGSADVLDWLARVPSRAGLEHLDLSGGTLQDADAWRLASHRWPRLRHLDVSNNELGSDGIARLVALDPSIVIGEQRRPEALDDDEVIEGEDDEDDEYYESAME